MGSPDSFERSNVALESDPDHYSVVFDADEKAAFDERNTQRLIPEWAACVNVRTGKIFIGLDHGSTLKKHRIPKRDYIGAVLDLHKREELVRMTQMIDWRKEKEVKSGPIRDAILKAIQRDVFGEPPAREEAD